MGSDDLFKKRRGDRKQRRHEYKTPRMNSFLIVSEGERTEPLYFKGIQKQIQDKTGGVMEVVQAPVIDIHGEGCATRKLVELTERIVKNAKILYQNIWIVLDKDDFPDFDQAIKEGEEKGYNIAWSNQSFEYWLYLHFYYSDSALDRHGWNQKLDEIFEQYQLGDGAYQKNYEDIFQLVNKFDGVKTAVKNAERRMADFRKDIDRPSDYNPGTMVHKLVRELMVYLED